MNIIGCYATVAGFIRHEDKCDTKLFHITPECISLLQKSTQSIYEYKTNNH